MADQLCTPSDLASHLQQDLASLNSATLTLLIECATAVVQEAAGNQRILQVVADSAALLGTTDNWLNLPQIPVTAVTSVTLDGAALTANTDYKVFGNRLWRRLGWQTNYGWPWDYPYGYTWSGYYPPPSWLVAGYPYQEPSQVVVVNTHGYPSGAQQLQRARQAVLALAAGVYVNPSATTNERIDDYSATYEAMAARMETSPHLRASLRKTYGRRGGLTRIG